MANLQESTKDVFFSKKNEGMLERLLTTDINRRIGADLSPKQQIRLEKTIDYYMGKVYEDPTYMGKPVQVLNKHVLQAVIPDYMNYLKRPSRPEEDSDMDRIRNDVSSRFDTMQQQRQGDKGAPPNPPNFQLSLEDDGPPSISLFEKLKHERELEAKRLEETQTQAKQPTPVAKMPTDMVQRLQSDDMFRSGFKEATQNDMNSLALRESSRRAQMESGKNQIMDVPPDPRRVFFGENEAPIFSSRNQGLANANPTLILPEAISTRTPLPQDLIKSQGDVVSYKDNEYNLFIYSADRDWANKTTENRYSFSVNFDPANNRSGFGLSPSTYIKFKNIARIELVKVIMSTESCETLTTKTSSTAYNTDSTINVFSYPYLQVRIDELNTNGFGTNDGVNNAFGVVSYDAYWASDSALKNRGYTRLIPKFLKCQKVFYPTPLATLQKMTIQIQKPDGTQFCTSDDAFDISGIVTSAQLGTGGPPPTTPITPWEPATPTVTAVSVAGTNYYDTSGEFLWIQATAWFSQFAITQGDRVVLKNVQFASAAANLNGVSATDFLSYINRAEGHIVVDVAQVYVSSATMYFKTGSNKVGYSNFIIIRNKFNDPITGSSAVTTWGGNATLNTAFLTALAAAPHMSAGRLLNMSHQVQLIFRVITRDMDSATRLRPDNL